MRSPWLTLIVGGIFSESPSAWLAMSENVSAIVSRASSSASWASSLSPPQGLTAIAGEVACTGADDRQQDRRSEPLAELLVDAPGQAGASQTVGADRVQPDGNAVVAQHAGPDDEDALLTARDLRLVLADQPRAGRNQNAAAVEGIDVLGDDRPHLPGQVADDGRLENAGDQRALRNEGVDALDLARLGRTVAKARGRGEELAAAILTGNGRALSASTTGQAPGSPLAGLSRTTMFERKRSGNSSGGVSTASAGGGAAAGGRRWRHVELGRVDGLLRRRWRRRWRRGNSTISGSAGSGCGSPSRTKDGGRKVVVVNSSSPSSMSRAGCCLTRHDEVAGNEPEEDENAAADQLVAADGPVGDDRIVGFCQRFEFGRALHQLPLLRRFVALSSSTGPRIAGSGAPKSGFLRLKMQIHWSPSRSVNWVAVPSTTMYSPSLRKFSSVSEKSALTAKIAGTRRSNLKKVLLPSSKTMSGFSRASPEKE